MEIEDQIKESGINILEYSKSLVKHSFSQIEEHNFIFVGEKFSGKTTIFNTIFSNKKEKETTYIETCGINYNNATVTIGGNNKKILLNGFEIAGDISLIKNLIFENNFNFSTFVIVLDLSKPERVLESLLRISGELNKIFTENISSEILEESSKKQIKNTADSKIVKINPGKIVVVPTKYDLFEKLDV
jgi:outer membrane receptor for ferrienterochelin and colicin